jgi:ABC-type glutathione transport system ATPase component
MTRSAPERRETTAPAVDVVDLEKRFYRRRRHRNPSVALAAASFSIARRECVAILGQNGSGKSTLVRLDSPSARWRIRSRVWPRHRP